VKPGDTVRKGDPLWTISADDASRIPRALEALEGAWELAEPGADVPVPPIVRERIA
jgi:thymidine phosphorylase